MSLSTNFFATQPATQPMEMLQPLNRSLILSVLILVSIGLVMVATASMDFAAVNYNDPWYFVKRHIFYLVIAFFAALIMYSIPKSLWQRYGWILFFVCMFMLVLVLVPGIGRRVNGSQRWIQLGPLTLQVSEFVKLFSVVFFASYLQNSQYFLQTQWRELFKPLLMLVVVMWLLLLEPDFGAAVVLAVTIGSMLFFAGAKLWQCFLLMLAGFSVLASLVWFTPYRMQRLITFLDPWADQFDTGYQLIQSLIAFGRGQWSGLGLGNGIQKLLYLPESHTDFIFAIYAEEQGFIGVVFLLALFIFLITQILRISRRAMQKNDTFVTLAAFGFGVLFSAQVIINVGVVSGFLPTKGLTLPFVSYGGSSLLACSMAIGLLLRLERDIEVESLRQAGGSRE